MAALWACEKQNSNLNTSKQDYFPMTTGSYWVYNTYEVDSLNQDSLISKNDTVVVIGDTLVRGEEYKVFRGKYYGFSKDLTHKYYRDSLGYIVNSGGRIVLYPEVNGDTLYRNVVGDSMAYFYTIMANESGYLNSKVITDGDLLNCQFFIDVWSVDTIPTIKQDNYYAPNIGSLTKQYSYFSQLITKGVFYEDRLVDYHIEP